MFEKTQTEKYIEILVYDSYFDIPIRRIQSINHKGHGSFSFFAHVPVFFHSFSMLIPTRRSIYLSLSHSHSARYSLCLERAEVWAVKKKESSHCTCNCEFGAFATIKYGGLGLDCIEADFCKLCKQFCWMIYNPKFYKIYTLLPCSERRKVPWVHLPNSGKFQTLGAWSAQTPKISMTN